MFLYADNDGFKLDANHDQPIDEDDLPDLIAAFHDRVGRCAVFSGNRRAAYASYLIRARLKSDSVISSEYVAGTLSTVMMRKVILSLARTTAGNYNINIASLSRLPIPVPPIDLQRRYMRIVQAARFMVPLTEAGSSTALALSASLMSRLLGSMHYYAGNPKGVP